MNHPVCTYLGCSLSGPPGGSFSLRVVGQSGRRRGPNGQFVAIVVVNGEVGHFVVVISSSSSAPSISGLAAAINVIGVIPAPVATTASGSHGDQFTNENFPHQGLQVQIVVGVEPGIEGAGRERQEQGQRGQIGVIGREQELGVSRNAADKIGRHCSYQRHSVRTAKAFLFPVVVRPLFIPRFSLSFLPFRLLRIIFIAAVKNCH